MERKKKRRWPRLVAILLALVVVMLCMGSASVAVMADRTGMLGVVYLQSVRSGNVWLAELIGDHFSDEQSWQQRFYAGDIQRDMSYLQGADISGVSTSREQTLSGQWVTVVRYNWREAGSSGDWNRGALRVKTDHWFFITYIRAVELIEP